MLKVTPITPSNSGRRGVRGPTARAGFSATTLVVVACRAVNDNEPSRTLAAAAAAAAPLHLPTGWYPRPTALVVVIVVLLLTFLLLRRRSNDAVLRREKEEAERKRVALEKRVAVLRDIRKWRGIV